MSQKHNKIHYFRYNISNLNRMNRYTGLLLLILVFKISAQAQITSSGTPYLNPASDTFFIPEILIELDQVDLTGQKKVFSGKESTINFKNEVFAEPVQVDISPEKYGRWLNLPDQNKKIWILKISSPEAISLTVVFDTFALEPGVKVFVYDSLKKNIVGALTSRNNLPSKVLPIKSIPGQTFYIEMQVPKHYSGFGQLNTGIIGVQKANDNLLKNTKDEWFNTSSWCNYNVNCFNEPNVFLQKQAVCRIIYLGSRRCTGTLLNNLNSDGTPYVITAAHCISSEFLANTAVFFFNYESPSCEKQDGLTNNSISGASLVASGFHVPGHPDTLDFALLKLSESPPLDFLPYYSAWDASGVAPDSTFVIHHPMGDVKKLSYDRDMPETGNAGLGFDDNTHWLLKDYTLGTSEVGSSGAGLINGNGHLIGTLTGGGDACSKLINDFYQKFSHVYNDYSDPKYQVKHWLDPKNTGKLVCEAYDPSGIFRQTSLKLANYNSVDEFESAKHNSGWGYVSGHNYQGNSVFAEKFSINGSLYLYGAQITPAEVYAAAPEGFVSFFVSQGNVLPGKVIFRKNIPVSQFDKNIPYYIDFDSTLLVSNNFYFGYEILYNSDTFALMTIPVPESFNTSFSCFDNSWDMLHLDNSKYPAHLAVKLFAFNFMPHKGVFPDTTDFSAVSIYPNPANSQLQVLFKETPESKVIMKLYDLYGRQVLYKEFIEPLPNIPFALPSERGVYILHVQEVDKKPVAFKVLVY